MFSTKFSQFNFIIFVLICLYSPSISNINKVGAESFNTDLLNQMNQYILNSSLVSSTSTEFYGIEFETSSSNLIDQIESSTTTLSIEAPFIKQWQASGGITKNLSVNIKDNQVLLLQGALKGLVNEFKPTYITSYFGPKTTEAVKVFQKKYNLPPTGVVGPKTREVINQKYFNDLCPQKQGIDKKYENLNRINSIPFDYTPPELTKLVAPIRTAGIICLSSDPSKRLRELFIDAKKNQIDLIVLSGYRRPEIQKLLLAWSNKNKVKNSEVEALSLAEAGHSEHQLGTTIDFSGKSMGFKGPSTSFGKSREGQWLKNNSYKYGFIMSYPEGKEDVTGYIYEPWHFRYVGVDIAKDIYQQNLSIQEYFNLVQGNSQGTSTNI